MNDKNNNTKTPESNCGAPAGLTSAPFFVTFPFPPFDLPRPSTMPPTTFPDKPFYRTVENTYSPPSFENESREQNPSYRNRYSISREEQSREQAPVYNTHSNPESFMDRAMYSSIQMNDSILASFPCYPEASGAARPTTPADFKKHKPMIARQDEERAAKLLEFRDLYNLDLMSREEPERKRSPSLMSTDESDSDYLYPDTESESESDFFEEEESNPSPALDCKDDECDGDYTAPNSESDSESESGSEHDPEEQGTEMPPSISEELRTLSPPGFAWSRPHIPSWNDLGPRDDDMSYNNLFGPVPAPPISPYIPPTAPCTPTPPQGQEQIRSSSPVDDDSLSTLGQALEKASGSIDDGSLDTLSQSFEKALEKHQSEDLVSAKPSLSQDLEMKVHSSISAYDLNMEKLRKDINEQSDHIRERCDRLEKEKRDRDNAVPPTVQEWVDAVFPGPGIPLHEREKVKIERCSRLAEREREQVRLERCRRLAERYQEHFGISGNAIAGPSKEQEKKTSLSSKLDEMIREGLEKLRELEADREVNRARPVGADVGAAWGLDSDARLRVPSPKPKNPVGMSLEGTDEEMDALFADLSPEVDKDALPDYETDMELLLDDQESLPASTSSSQGQKRKRATAADHKKLIFENFEKMRQHVREGVGREKKRHKASDQSFEEFMNRLYPADSEIWKIDEEPIPVRSSKPEESRSDEDLGNGGLLSSDDFISRAMEHSINDVANGSDPSADIPPFADKPPLAPMPAFPPFPIIPAMPNDSLSNIGPKKYPITRPASLTLPQSMPCYHAICLTASRDHEPWRPETEILEAVSDKPFNEWVDITGMREFIHDELSRFGCSKVTVEACRVTGEENVRLMVFMPKRVHRWNLHLSRYRISNRLSLWGITDVKVEIWETDFHLQVV